MSQTQLFDRDYQLTESANQLLEMRNDGLKEKEKYLPHFYIQEKDKIILIAVNSEKDIMCNVLDFDGNTPDGFTACWRIWSEVLRDLNKSVN